jgi:hypothetical protein
VDLHHPSHGQYPFRQLRFLALKTCTVLTLSYVCHFPLAAIFLELSVIHILVYILDQPETGKMSELSDMTCHIGQFGHYLQGM